MVKRGVVCLFAWLVPGGGHVLLKKWGRGVTFFAVVMLLFSLGLAMEGQLFGWPQEKHLFPFLKFLADASVGFPYLIGVFGGWGEGDIHSFSYEYGNSFLYTAGLLNMLLILDAFDIAQGRKP